MNLNQLFLGKPLHWLLWLVLIVALYALGSISFHVKYFVPFFLILLALTAAFVFIVIFSYQPGERITREPFDET